MITDFLPLIITLLGITIIYISWAITKYQSRTAKPKKVYHCCQIKEGAVIGEGTIIGHNTLVMDGAIIGRNAHIQGNTDIWNGVIIEGDVFIGPSVVFTNDKYPRVRESSDRSTWKRTFIKKGASIGANATIVCGVTIGEYAMVGAGSVVTKDVPPFALVYGNPAKQHATVDIYGNISRKKPVHKNPMDI